VDSGIPTQLSYGFICGYTSGFALKRIGKLASFFFGVGFITLQSLSYSGYIQVNHEEVKKTIEKILDTNNDGVVDRKDGDIINKKIKEVLTYNLPAGGGFSLGFLSGLKSG